MNREQAEHILDAYIDLENVGGDNKARMSLREVILDAMIDDKKISTVPNITYPPYTPFTNPTVTPWTEPYKPIVTCGNDVTQVVEQ